MFLCCCSRLYSQRNNMPHIFRQRSLKRNNFEWNKFEWDNFECVNFEWKHFEWDNFKWNNFGWHNFDWNHILDENPLDETGKLKLFGNDETFLLIIVVWISKISGGFNFAHPKIGKYTLVVIFTVPETVQNSLTITGWDEKNILIKKNQHLLLYIPVLVGTIINELTIPRK